MPKTTKMEGHRAHVSRIKFINDTPSLEGKQQCLGYRDTVPTPPNIYAML